MAETPIAFHSLTFVAERDGVMVGRPDTETYVALPDEGAQLLRRLADGMAPGEATGWYRSTFGESVDMDDFLQALNGLGFVRAPDERRVEPAPVRYRALARAMFSPVAWVLYGAVVAASVLAMVWHPELRPAPGHVFFVPSLIAVQAVLLVVQMPGIMVHEWFHVMAARRRGLPARLTVGRRLFFAVFETELNGLLSIARRQRYLVFLAGMLADVLVITGLTLVAAAAGNAWPARLALAIAYVTLLRLAWQLLVFLRTDPYFVLTTALGCTNLAEAGNTYLRERWRRSRGAPARSLDENDWTPRDRAMAPWFAAASVVGTAGLVTALGFGAVPVLVEFVTRLAIGLTHGSVGGSRFWDSVASLTALSLEFAVFPLLMGRRNRIQKRRKLTSEREHGNEHA